MRKNILSEGNGKLQAKNCRQLSDESLESMGGFGGANWLPEGISAVDI
ncbi:MAG: hypothetical protein MJZ93_02965 [Paludibacteraceae bacterium]|nr:hypothetical protein [Paludibacteraceae bacterium]